MVSLKFFNPLHLMTGVTNYAFFNKFKPVDCKLNCNAYNYQFDQDLITLLKSDVKDLSPEAQVVYLKAFFVTHVG